VELVESGESGDEVDVPQEVPERDRAQTPTADMDLVVTEGDDDFYLQVENV